MKIGKLNELEKEIGFRVTFADTELAPGLEVCGNPLKGEQLFTKWKSIRDSAVELHISLPRECFVDTVVLTLGEKTALSCLEVQQNGQVLCLYHAETGKSTSDREIALTVGALCKDFSVIVTPDFSTLDILGLDIYGAAEDGVDLFPTPNTVSIGEDTVSVSRFTGWCADSPEGAGAAQILAEKYQEKAGIALTEKEGGEISFVTAPSLPADGYDLKITNTGVTVCASSLRGFVCGAETFIKLIRDDCVPTVKISDSPAKAFRGVHLFIPSMAQMDFARRLIKYMISPMGYNTIIMQVSGGMVYESHPKISQAFANAVEMQKKGLWPAFPHSGIAEGKPITKAQLKEFLSYIKSFGIDVIPEVQSLGHVQYMTHAYPQIAEIPEVEELEKVDTREEDMLPSQFYRHSYCPSNERSYEILFDIIDEIIEVFQPKEFVHMGHDEVREIGVCSKCKGKDPAQLLAQDIIRIHDYLAAKGLKMMIWADMLQPVTKYQTPPAIDMIPKDIVLLDFIWYFHLTKDIEDNLLEKGFDVIIGNLYSSHFPRFESRIRKEGILGGQISAWTATNEYEMQKEGKLYDILMTAQMLWAESYSRYYHQVYDRMLRANMPQLRENLNGIRYPSRRSGARISDFVPGNAYDSLIFSHTALRKITRLPWSELDIVARYIISYTDGSTEEVPVTYGGNVGYIGRRQNEPLRHKLYRHTGYTATYYTDSITTLTENGEPVTMYVYEYLPKSDKPITSIELVQNPAFDAKILVKKIEGVTV